MAGEVVAGTVGCIGATLLLLLVGSIGYVEQNEYGLRYNWITKTITKDVYHGGTHFIGFWNAFEVFPATVQTIEFSERRYMLRTTETLHTRTKEGLALHLSISFQYLLDPTKLPQLYALTNVRYEGLFVRIARDQLLEAASDYEGPQYWLHRHKIGSHMKRLVAAKLKESYAELWGLQLLVIDLPDRYESAITRTQVQSQIIKTRHNEQAAASIRANTEIMRAEYERRMKVVQAGAEANFTKKTRLAVAEASRRKIAAEAEALKYVREKLKLSPMGAVQYQELTAYDDLPNATFLANVPGARAVVGMPAALSFLQRRSGYRLSQSQAPDGRAGAPRATPARAKDPQRRSLRALAAEPA